MRLAAEEGVIGKTPCLQDRQEWVNLLILQVMDEIMMLVLPDSCPVASSVADSLAAIASPSMKIESHQVSRYLLSIRRDHIPSFRLANLPFS